MSESLTLRRAAMTDAPALLRLVRATSLAERDESDATLQDIEAELARSTYLAWAHEDEAGEVDGVVSVEKLPGESAIFGSVIRDPAHGDRLLAPLLEVARQRARELDPSLRLHLGSDVAGTAKCELFAAAGGTVIRGFLRMTRDISSGVPAAEFGSDVTIRVIRDGDDDLRAMYGVLETAFLDHFGAEPTGYEEWIELHSEPSLSDRSLWWLATVDGQPAAGLIGRAGPHRGWVEAVGTLRAYRGRGLARALLLTAFEEFRVRGFDEVGLGVDATNPTGAVALYESLGMHATNRMTVYEFAS